MACTEYLSLMSSDDEVELIRKMIKILVENDAEI
jgi:hypothetical protein